MGKGHARPLISSSQVSVIKVRGRLFFSMRCKIFHFPVIFHLSLPLCLQDYLQPCNIFIQSRKLICNLAIISFRSASLSATLRIFSFSRASLSATLRYFHSFAQAYLQPCDTFLQSRKLNCNLAILSFSRASLTATLRYFPSVAQA